ncbi:MAG: glycosyltransferase [Clostridia bacterium]|nr:glycosyltransferase [Clostridia bacterium]
MKILFVSTAFSFSGSATGILIGHLMNSFKGKGHTVDCLTTKKSLYDPDTTDFNGCNVFHANYSTRADRNKIFPKDYIHAVEKRILKYFIKFTKSIFNPREERALFKQLHKINANKYDAIIAVCADHVSINAVLKYKAKVNGGFKTILIQYDPLAENFELQRCGKEKLIKAERFIYDNCDYIFTADYIFKQKSSDWLSNKIVLTELPAIIKREAESFEGNEYIDCVYAGDFYKGIREPDFMLELFSLFKNPKIRLFVLSSGEKQTLQRYADNELKDRLFIIGRVGEKECNNWLNKADILVNIGNKINNQLPSKVLNYMCFGKPVLNLYAIDDCPSLPYFEKYPLSINADMQKPLNAKVVSEIEKSITEFAGKNVSFEEVEKNFIACTPDYVTDSILKKLN